ncbi:hypothetical protein AB4428_05630 [Vibrio lentus]
MSSLTKAIVLLRARVRARHQGDADQLKQLNADLMECQPFVGQVQQALKLNRDGMTLSKVTPGWVKSKMRASEGV